VKDGFTHLDDFVFFPAGLAEAEEENLEAAKVGSSNLGNCAG